MPKIVKRTTKVGQAMQKAGLTMPKNREPVWKGPEEDGITQSLLSRFLVCRERFRLLMVEGLKPAEGFNQRLEYGNMWHMCEEVFAASGNPIVSNPVADPPWLRALKKMTKELQLKYRNQQEQVVHWYNVCKTQFPIYIQYWKKHKDVMQRTPLLSEYSFAIPYTLPSGRVVKLRGKFDSVDIVGKGKTAAIWLQENKTKGDVNEIQLKRQLTFDLQTMLYLVALNRFTVLRDGDNSTKISGPNHEWFNSEGMSRKLPPRGLPVPIVGVRYNVIKRPLSGGAGTIRKHQPTKSNPRGESDEEFYSRLGGIIEEKADEFFMRWNVEISQEDIETFKTQCLNPHLESLCDWWEWIEKDPYNPWREGNVVHYRTPFGMFNPMLEGNVSDLDHYLATGDETGLQRTENLFPEL